MKEIVQVSRLTKDYPAGKGGEPIRAVDGLGFTINQGEVFGFLGPNGAGKTTTLRILTGLIRPTTGKVIIMGKELFTHLSEIKKCSGVVPDRSNLYDELSAFDNLVFDMQLYGVPRSEWTRRAEMLLINFGLIEKRNTPFAKLSHGMKRALTIAAALAHTPSLVFLDEPTTGLDVLNARKLRKMISSLREEGVTVFLTTHYLEEAERLCDRIGLIVRGKLIALDTVAGLKARVQDKGMSRVEISWKDEFNALKSAEIEGVSADDAIRKALMLTQGFEIMSINTQLPSMEDVFVQLTGLNAEAMLAEKGNGKGN